MRRTQYELRLVVGCKSPQVDRCSGRRASGRGRSQRNRYTLRWHGQLVLCACQTVCRDTSTLTLLVVVCQLRSDNLLPFTVVNSCGYKGFLDFVHAVLEHHQIWFDCCFFLFQLHLGTCHRLQGRTPPGFIPSLSDRVKFTAGTSLMQVVERVHETTTARLNVNRVHQLDGGGFQFVVFSLCRRGFRASLRDDRAAG